MQANKRARKVVFGVCARHAVVITRQSSSAKRRILQGVFGHRLLQNDLEWCKIKRACHDRPAVDALSSGPKPLSLSEQTR